MKNAAISGASELPKLPPTWNSDCAKPCAPPEARRATREDSGWKIAEPIPSNAAPASTTSKARRKSQYCKAQQRAGHAKRQRIGLRPMIGVKTDDRLQQRRDALIDQRDEADLREAEIEVAFEHRINSRQQRRRHIVEEMAKGDRSENRNGCGAGLWPADNGLAQGIKTFPDLCRLPSARSVLGGLS